MSVVESQRSLLGMKFDRYLPEHQECAENIPDNDQIILQMEGDEKFNQWSTRIGKAQAVPDQPIIYVRIKELAAAHSGIQALDLVIGL